jgi:tripartite-type tricarboxylate transporter receptor subunit TctC
MPASRTTPCPSARRRLLRGAAAATAALGLPAWVPAARAAEAWPAGKPIRWIVGFPAGGAADFLARQLAPGLGRALGQTVVIENRPGAAGIIATDAAAKSPADGFTLLTGDNGAMVFHPPMQPKLPYAPSDFAPVGFMARFPLFLVVPGDSPIKDVATWLSEVRRSPGRLSYASPGIGSPHHLAMELLKDRTKTFLVHVPYRGTTPALQDVLGGTVPTMVVDSAAGMAHIRSGRLRALAVLQRERAAVLPDVPTLGEAAGEAALKDFQATAWQALFVPKGTPSDIVARLSAELQKALAEPAVRARLEDFGLEVRPGDAAALARFLDAETTFWTRLIRERGLKAE